MKLRADHWSDGAARVATRHGLQAKSFALAAAGYSEAVGGAISDESVRRITEGWGAQCELQRNAEAEQANAPAQRGEHPGEARLTPRQPIQTQANLSSDGAMLLVRGEGWKEVKLTAISAVSVQAAGARAVDSAWPSHRAQDPLVSLSQHSYQAGLWDVETFAHHQYAEGLRRGLDQCARLSSVNDAAEWIERSTHNNFPAAEQIVDWSHAAERLWLVGNSVLGEGSAPAARWVEARRDKLWDGNPTAVISALTHLHAKALASAQPLVEQNITYFRNHQSRMQYDAYRAAGYPIGSGTIESAANNVVHHRLKRPGRGWTRDNGQAMLAALSELHSDRFDHAWRSTQPAHH